MLKPIKLYIVLVICIGSIACKDKNAINDKHVFKYNELGSVTSMDPAAAKTFENMWVTNQIYDGLVQMDDSLNILPSIAKSWQISSDGKVYTFHLRSDVYFHNNVCFKDGKGRKVVANDFINSFYRLFDPKVSSAISFMQYIDKNDSNGFRGFKAANDSTLKLYLKAPFTPFINILAMKYFSVIPEEAIARYGEDFRRNPVGTGPFQFNFWEEGNKMVLTKNPLYFEKENGVSLPYLDGVAISFIRDKETAFLQFIKGDFDLLSGLDAFNSNEVLDANGKLKPFYEAKIQLQGMPYIKTDYLGFIIDDDFSTIKKSPIVNKKIRQAINYAIDRDKIVAIQRNNLALAAKGFVPTSICKYAQPLNAYTYNPDMVAKLLSDAGVDKDHPLQPIIVHTTEQNMEICEMIQGQLQENGIPIKILVDKASVISQSVASGEFNFFKRSWIGDYADSENFLQLFYSKNFSPDGSNYFHFKSATFDRYYEQSMKEQNDSIRNDLKREMEQIVLDEAPCVPLFYDYVVRLVQKNIEGIQPNGLNSLNLKRVRKH
jgi:oligopeptide transport system substrate-binding protein